VSYRSVLDRIEAAALRSGRTGSEVTLVAVSKGQSVGSVMTAYEAGHRDFGENRAQEMAEKARHLPADIRWHFVGALQTNKTRLVRPITALLHSLDRRSLALAWLKGPGLPPPVLVQVNLGDESQKSGATLEEAPALVDMAVEIGLQVRGLMAIPPAPDHPDASRPHFRTLRALGETLRSRHPDAVELSMGMTDDFEVAIEEGATIIRVGRAIFGPRN
jgi:pyridoxal phosphate enzyme (YggS family)